MDIMLHRPGEGSQLGSHYKNAFQNAVELYIVSAYLTEWDQKLTLPATCTKFRFIIGKDFGITKKNACRKVMRWLPAHLKADFMVADEISGFHPKAVIWRDAGGKAFMLAGSSNLTRAAFDGNVEANLLVPIPQPEFRKIVDWIEWIESRCKPVSEDWLEHYVEAKRVGGGTKPGAKTAEAEAPVVPFKLPRPSDTRGLLKARRAQLSAYQRSKHALIRHFSAVADGEITNNDFFLKLPTYWGFEKGNRLQGMGWERVGKRANFQQLAKAFLAISQAHKSTRDDVVRRELDVLHKKGNPARAAFFSEMLCLHYPDQYPLLNDPVREFIAKSEYAAPRGATEGARYIDLARKLRTALAADPNYPAKNLAELDLLIWASSEKRKMS